MAKTKISEYSATSADNTDISNINIAEGCSPANVNNAIRTIMAQLKDQQAGTSGDNFTVGGNLSVTGTSTLTGNVTAPTQSSSDNSTKVATTAFVTDKVGTLGTMASQNATAVAITGGTITGLSSPLPVASGGTGATTSTGSGNNVLSVSPTLTTPNLGTPSTIVLTNATGTANSLNAGIGVNQTWQNVASSRAYSVTYTNSTGKPIMVKVVGTGAVNNLVFYIDGNELEVETNLGSAQFVTVGGIVPNGSTYSCVGQGGLSVYRWHELR